MYFRIKSQYLLLLVFAFLRISDADVDCGNKYSVANGKVDFTGRKTTAGSSVPVKCDTGYKLHGDSHITCQKDGLWSSGTTCQIIDCGKTTTLENGQIQYQGKPTTFNHSVPIACNDGYRIIGPPYLTCLDDGTWSSNTVCHPLSCEKKYSIPNGEADFKGRETFVNSTVPINCNDGYELHGSSSITCQPDGTWTTSTSCRIKDCGNKYAPDNGRVDYNGKETTYGQSLPVTCDDGYNIHGKPQITCLADGTWSKVTSCIIKDCGTKYSMAHGHVNFTGKATTYSSVVRVTCDKGYQIHGEHHITCLSDGSWSKKAQCLPTIDCGTKYKLINGNVNFTGSDTTYGHRVQATCNIGYKLVGDHYIACLANGSWSRNTVCQLVDCGTKYSIHNGYPNFFGRQTTYKQIVPITCNMGYELHGDEHITCLNNGKWSRKTSCLVKNCSTSHTIENGNVDLTGRPTKYGSVASVSCNEGYEIHDNPFITCLADGTWSKDTSCMKKDCGTNYQLENGHVDYKGRATTVGEKVPLFCNSGYDLEGDPDTTCLSDGTWSKFTYCRSKDCGTEFSIDNGYADFIRRDTTFNKSVPIVCDVGYEIQGDQFTTCQADGTWSENTKCQIIDCGNTYDLEHGYINFIGVDTTYGSKVPVACEPGYDIIGNYSITCEADGKWSQNTACRVKDCGTKYHLENGHVDFAGRKTIYNEKVPVLCNDGYDIQGDYEIICKEDGTWSQHSFCRIRDCGSELVVENGYVEFSGKPTTFDSIIAVTCSDGYKNQGEDHITCLANGTWTKHTACQIRDCGARYSLMNGHVDFTGKSTKYNQIVPVTCSPGYEVHGDEFITCLSNGDWSTTECHPKDCGRQYSLDNGHVEFGKDTTFDQNAAVVCDPGYEIQGAADLTCRKDGTWSKSSRCHIKDCGTEYVLDHGFANFDGQDTTFGHSVPVICNKGYEILGDPKITCQANGKWSNTSYCHIEDCGTVYNLENGKANFTGRSTKYNKKVPISCDVGYDIVGDPFITCLANGSWSSESSCKIKDCGKGFALDGGQVDFTGHSTTYNSKVSVSCLDGYDLKGDNFITCLASGQWSKTATCVAKDCGAKYSVEHGHVDFTGQDTTFKNKVLVKCNTGYETDGPQEITCLATGSWSTDSKCRIKDCGTDFDLKNGHIDFAGKKTVFNHTLPVACDPGYDRHGDAFTTCQADGKWSEKTTCIVKDCGNAYQLADGHVNFTGAETTYGHKIAVTCKEGYGIVGDSHISCLANGTWSINTQCQIRDCGKNYNLTHGSVDLTGKPTTYNQSFTAACEDNYVIEGSPHITCLANGTWSRQVVCRANPAKATGNTGAVVGGVISGLVAVIIIAVIIVMMRKNQKLCFAKTSILEREFGDLENENRVTM